MLISRLPLLSLFAFSIGGCALWHRQSESVELRAEDRDQLDSLALAFVASIRAGDTVGAKRLAVDTKAFTYLLTDDSALVLSNATMRASDYPGYRHGDSADRIYIFVSAPASTRCPHEPSDTWRDFTFVRRGGVGMIQSVIPPFC